MHFRIAYLACAAACLAAHATTLIALWAPDRLLIGADSNVITNVPNAIGTGCKISQDGSNFYAFSGLVEDRSVGYNIRTLAHEAIRGTGDLSAHLSLFLKLARDPLTRAVSALRSDSPDEYAYLQQNHPVLQAIFAGVEPGPPILGVAGFSLDPDGSLVDFSRIVARGTDGLGTRIIYAGRQDQIQQYLRQHRDWALGDPAELVRTLIQSEADASEGEVGGPIDIISIEPNTAHWIQHKPQCR